MARMAITLLLPVVDSGFKSVSSAVGTLMSSQLAAVAHSIQLEGLLSQGRRLAIDRVEAMTPVGQKILVAIIFHTTTTHYYLMPRLRASGPS